MSYSETINYLYSLQKHGIKLGLQNISRLMSVFDNPHTSFISIHVAGTNGKGSTSAIIASLLKATGMKVGLFTSPHIVSFSERIRIDDKEISEQDVVELAEEVKDKVESLEDFSPTFFEVVTAMTLLYFKRKKVDAAVLEVGMGGRLDATNIITPVVSVITNISYDHNEFLGNTLAEIAYEKAGIIKNGIPVVSSLQNREALEVIEKKTKEKNARLYLYNIDFFSTLKWETISEICFDYHINNSFRIHNLHLPLTGEYQMQNASVAIRAAMIALDSLRLSGSLSNENVSSWIKKGLAETKWPGRLEMLKEAPLIIIDGAHNPAAADALSGAIKKIFLEKYKRIIILLGIMGDKDAKGIMQPLLPLASEVILTSPEYDRASPPERLAEIAISSGFSDVKVASTVKDALKMAEGIANASTVPSLILVTGSFYTIGEAKEALGIKGILTRLRE
jgi:dihydrofolate synthase/folylpolyglutamate synthase